MAPIGAKTQAVAVFNETLAHAAGTAHFAPEVDALFEIGGQDAEYVSLRVEMAWKTWVQPRVRRRRLPSGVVAPAPEDLDLFLSLVCLENNGNPYPPRVVNARAAPIRYDGAVARHLDYQDHRRELDENRYVYAVVSRRARGLSIGVNLNPDKACNFDCPYCQVDRTTPGGPSRVEVADFVSELEDLLRRAAGDLWRTPPFDTVAPQLRRVADVAFAGDGEPTTPPEFAAAARAAREARDRLAPGVPLRLLTNATLFHKDRVRAALADFDELWCKLDAGTEAYFHVVDGTRLPFQRILDNLLLVARERPIVVQSLFLTFDGVGPDDTEIAAWVDRLSEIVAQGGRIDHVQVYTVARAPSDPRVGPLGRERLEAIATAARGASLSAAVYA